MKKKYIFVLISISMLFLCLVACDRSSETNGSGSNQGSKGTLELAQPPWVNSPPQAWMVKVIIEDNLGWDVSVTDADIGLAFASTANGTTDFFVDAWLPGSHDAFVEEHGENIEILEPFTEVPPNGLIVPDYVDVNSIDELNEHKEKFDSRIIGIEPGAGIMETTNKALEVYGLEFTLIEGSDFAMTTAIGDAIDNNEWIVATGWSPHWMFTNYDLKYLDDPEGVYGGIRDIYPVINKDLREKAPEVVDFLNKWEVDASVWDELILKISVEEQDPETVIRNWVDNNQELVESWLE